MGHPRAVFAGFPQRGPSFLEELSHNNTPEWFDAHRDAYESALVEPAKAFVEAMGEKLRTLDAKLRAIPRVRGSIKALERRRRFARNPPPPYKTTLDIWFWSGPWRSWDNSGFFLRLTPTQLILAAGMIEFQKETLARYRARVLDEGAGAELESIVRDVRAAGYVVAGEGYRRTPRGVPAEHPRAELLRHRGLFARLEGGHPVELETAAFVGFAYEHFARMAPLHSWLVALGT